MLDLPHHHRRHHRRRHHRRRRLFLLLLYLRLGLRLPLRLRHHRQLKHRILIVLALELLTHRILRLINVIHSLKARSTGRTMIRL